MYQRGAHRKDIGSDMYKLKFYTKSGNFSHEEVFTSLKEMDARYCYCKDVVCPTAWVFINNDWSRMLGY